MNESHLYPPLTQETNKVTTSYCSDHQHPQARKPEQSLYTTIVGMSSITILAQENHTLESQDPTSTNSTERTSHQTTNLQSKTQTKNPSYQGPSHQNQAEAKHQPAHLSLTKISAALPHHQTKTPPPSPDIDDLHHQTNITLASLLLSRNKNRPHQIWRLRLLRLQQQQLLSDLTLHQQTPPWR
jgi:hypothetical protein